MSHIHTTDLKMENTDLSSIQLFVSVLGFISVFAELIKASVKLPRTWKGQSSHRLSTAKNTYDYTKALENMQTYKN